MFTKKAHNLPKHVTDVQSGFRAYSRKAIHTIRPQDTGMGASIDILVQATRHSLRIKEEPITIRHHSESSTHNPLLHAAILLVHIIETVAEKRPLFYLGLPGAAAAVTGTILLGHVVHIFTTKHTFALIEVLISTILLFVGLILSTLAVLLYVLLRLRASLCSQGPM